MTEKVKRHIVLERLVRENGWTVGVELGVWRASVISHLLKTFPELVMYGVDTWTPRFKVTKPKEEVDEARKVAHERLSKYGERAVIIEKDTALASYDFEEQSVDFVFIDADHSEEAVTRDITAWQSKIRPGGMLTGHDWNLSGVRAALDALLPGWKKCQPEYDHVWKYPV